MKKIIFLLFTMCTFLSYSQDKDVWLKGMFKDYQALTKSEQVSRKRAKKFLERTWTENFSLPKNASYKIVTLKLKEEENALFVLLDGSLYLFADKDILVATDAPPIDQPEPTPDPIPRPKPDPEPTPTPTPEDPKDPEPEDPRPKDGGTRPIICCGETYDCVYDDDECNCATEAPDCTGGEGKNKLFFEMLTVQQF